MENGTRKAMTGTNAMKPPAKGRVMAPLWSILLDGTLVATLKQDRVCGCPRCSTAVPRHSSFHVPPSVKVQLDLVVPESGNLWLATDAEATIQEWPDIKGRLAVSDIKI